MDFREFADMVIRVHGELKEVQLLENGNITIKFASAKEITLGPHDLDTPFRWGYYGTGPRFLLQFLRYTGFEKVDEDLIRHIEAPYTFKR